MDNCGSLHRSTTSIVDELENIHISSSSDSSDSEISKFYYSDSEPEFLSSTVLPVKYELPQRNRSIVHLPTHHTLMDRMAASNRSIRMKHGTTALDIMVPLNRDKTTTLEGGITQRDTTMRFGIPVQNALSASSSFTVPSSCSAQVPILPPRFRFSAPPYSYPPPYITPSNISKTFTFSKRSQFSTPSYPTPINTSPSSLQMNTSRTYSPFYTTQSPMPVYTSLSSSMTYTSQSFETSNTSQTFKYHKRSKYPIPPYVPPYSCPPYTTQSPMPVYTSLSSSLTYTSQSSKTSNTSQTSTSSLRARSSTSFYSQRYPTPTDSTSSFVPIYKPQNSTISNASQTSTYSKRTQSATLSYGLPYSTPPCSSKSSVPTYTSWSSTSTYNLTFPSFRIKPRSVHYSASPSLSHDTFPRSVHNTMPELGTHCTVMSQSSTQDSYPSSVYEPSINAWPTKIGSVKQVSMENILSVLATQLQNAPQPSTTTRADFLSRLANYQSPKCVNPNPSDSTKAASNACAWNHSEQSEEKLMPFYKNDTEKKPTYQPTQSNVMEHELKKAWLYFNKLEVVDIKPNGEVKCICPSIKFEDLLKSSINKKRVLVNLYRHYKFDNLLFETTHDYNSLPQKTIVTENRKNDVLQWLISLNMEEYDWFFNSLSLFEIENINPTNIQKFIMRSKSNKIISLKDQLKICCMVKQIKERPVSLLSILLNLQLGKIDQESHVNTVYPYITEIYLFPLSIQRYMFEDTMKESIMITMVQLYMFMIKLLNMDTQPNTSTTIEDFLDTEM